MAASPTTCWSNSYSIRTSRPRPAYTKPTENECSRNSTILGDCGLTLVGETRSAGMTRPFRFGVVAPLETDLPTWRDRVRRIADSGYSTLLMPDVPQWQPAPAPTLAVAATLADLRVGTWVYASPLRPAWSTAWEAHSLSVLTDGRFEMGIGTGRPGIEDELRERGLPVPSPSERLAQVRETITALRGLDGPDLHTPVVMAVR